MNRDHDLCDCAWPKQSLTQDAPGRLFGEQVCAYAILDVIQKCLVSFMVMGAHATLGQSVSSTKEIV